MSRPKPDDEERLFIGTRLKKAYVKKLKDIAYREERPLYNVVEEAIGQYLTVRARKRRSQRERRNKKR